MPFPIILSDSIFSSAHVLSKTINLTKIQPEANRPLVIVENLTFCDQVFVFPFEAVTFHNCVFDNCVRKSASFLRCVFRSCRFQECLDFDAFTSKTLYQSCEFDRHVSISASLVDTVYSRCRFSRIDYNSCYLMRVLINRPHRSGFSCGFREGDLHESIIHGPGLDQTHHQIELESCRTRQVRVVGFRDNCVTRQNEQPGLSLT